MLTTSNFENNFLDTFRLTVTADNQGMRLDKFLTEQLVDFSRSRIQGLIEGGNVTISPLRKPSCSLKLMQGDEIELCVPPAEEAIPRAMEIDLDIVYEDEDLLVINKAVGMVVHPAPGHTDDTLVNALLAHCGESLSGIGGVKRPGIVHRLDKDTSGLMVVAKNDKAHQKLTEQFSDRSLSRVYVALVWGLPTPSEGTIITQIGRHPRNRQKMAVDSRRGREAVTHYRSLVHYPKGDEPALSITLMECKLATGRTHQIRVHMHHMGHPLLGDPIYGHTPRGALKIWPETVTHFPRQALHAQSIQFIHPRTGETMAFEVDLPEDMAGVLGIISGLIKII